MSNYFKNMFRSIESGASGRKKRIDDAISGATSGKKVKNPTLGNPSGAKKKKKKK